MRRKATKSKAKPKKSLGFKIIGTSSYAEEVGISQVAAWRRLWPEDFKRKKKR
jgi:hypothetical protein